MVPEQDATARPVAGDPPRRHGWSPAAFAGLICLLTAGCTNWSTSVDQPLKLPAARMSPDSVALEVTFVRLPIDKSLHQRLWADVDEQWLPAEARGHLSENGMRVGVVGPQLTEQLRELLEQKSTTQTLTAQDPLQIDVLARNRRIQTRAGKRNEIVTGPPHAKLVVLHREPNGQRVRGNTYGEAQCVFATRCFPVGDGSARLELVPEVQHGKPRRQWIAGEGTFHLIAGRDREVYDDLRIEATLTPGRTLVLGAAAQSCGLGHSFFVESAGGVAQQKLLLIRLAQTQQDDLFDEPQPADRAANP